MYSLLCFLKEGIKETNHTDIYDRPPIHADVNLQLLLNWYYKNMFYLFSVLLIMVNNRVHAESKAPQKVKQSYHKTQSFGQEKD